MQAAGLQIFWKKRCNRRTDKKIRMGLPTIEKTYEKSR